MGNLVVDLVRAASRINLSRGVTNIAADALPKEMDLLFGGIRTVGADTVEIAHRYRNTGRAPFCIFDIKVKDKEGNYLDRCLGSISDWGSDGRVYSVKSKKVNIETAAKKPKLEQKGSKPIVKADDEVSGDYSKKADKSLKKDKSIDTAEISDKTKKDTKIKKDEKAYQPELPFDDIPEKVSKEFTKDKLKFNNEKPIPGVLPPEPKVIHVEPELINNELQPIPNIRDFELDALADETRRIETLAELRRTGRIVKFNPNTGKPNVFWSFDDNAVTDYFLKLIGRK